MAVACLVWGFSALYYKALAHIPPLEILAHRTLWSFVIFAGLLAVQGRLAALKGAVNTPRAAFIIGLAALMISVNWFSFIFSIQVGRATEAALGYYIFPLVAVLLGRIVFGERLGVVQWLAVALATGAVSLLTYGLGVAPWISLIVAFTFGLYGVVKKQLDIGPVVSVTAEVGMLVPVALVVLAVVHMRGQGHFGSAAWESGMLVFAGLLTALPLMLFSYATKRLQLSTVGLLQYINPSAQFFCAVVVFGEPFSGWHQLAFAMIWAGLLLYSLAALLQDRAARR
ncbi:EamA family transporter RarD [Lentibacter algarum]|nr:EamA family transporter RarD [Lentibacter algarum]